VADIAIRLHSLGLIMVLSWSMFTVLGLFFMI